MTDADILIRKANTAEGAADRAFILSLTATLAGVADLPWHSEVTILTFQENYILEMLDRSPEPFATFIAEQAGELLGFVHVCSHTEEISSQKCGTVPLLAVTERAQGKGVGKQLMAGAEKWAGDQGYSLLHLEVFAGNKRGQSFYRRIGYQPDTLVMMKDLKSDS